MKNYITFYAVLAILFWPAFGKSQSSVKDSVMTIPLLDFSYALQFPGADLADRFGVSSNVQMSFFVKSKSNFLFGVSGGYLFGDNVKEADFLYDFTDENGGIPGIGGIYADVRLYERGLNFEAKFGKVFPWFGPNMNSGPMVLIGAGYLQHRIRIEDANSDVPLFNEDNRKGYDRLTAGFVSSQFIGYRYIGNSKLINFFGGFEIKEAFTSSLRGYNYDTQSSDTDSRLDMQYGIRVGITLPIYKKAPKEYYFD
tara:strand:- start:9 stop:770 length:762 start_codon:yes stop_codon:yes gene_type:complete